MPVSPTWPGVYVQEISSGVRTITGVSTATALFVGYTTQGPTDEPTLCTSYSDFSRVYGEDNSAGDMTRQVKLFFLNGGTQCYIIRVASGTASSYAYILNELSSGTTRIGLELTALSPGTGGDLIRFSVSYDGSQPEDTFNLTIFRWEVQSDGTLTAKDSETLRGLTMDDTSGAYAKDVIHSNSKLVDAERYDPDGVVAATLPDGYSYAMYRFTGADPDADWTTLDLEGTTIQVSAKGSRYVSVTLPGSTGASFVTTATAVQTAIRDALSLAGVTPTDITVDFYDATTAHYLRVSCLQGSVFVRRGSSDDGAVALKWGTDQDGIEITPRSSWRPVPTGVTFAGGAFGFYEDLLGAATTSTPAVMATVTLNKYDADGVQVPVDVDISWDDTYGLLDILEAIRSAIEDGPDLDDGDTWPWTAELWGYRLAIRPIDGPNGAGSDDDRDSGFVWAWAGTGGAPTYTNSIRYYRIGATVDTSYQVAGNSGANGSTPISSTSYDNAYDLARKEVDLFNLLILPRSTDESVLSLEDLWANASIYCEERRALLMMEPPADWSGAQTPAANVTSLRVGMSKQYAALYYPRIIIKEDSVRYSVGATGAVAGLMARIDGSRGVWKAPAGTEADLRGVVGVDELLSDRENGVLNPRAINVIRSFPEGIICWGARTMDGDDRFSSEYKYVPIRRLAMYIEESLFRGLKWVVFEPNDEPLWAQIRLNVGAFMHGLFRQGAFQGKTPTEAYFVKCDSETTTQNDRNLGIVNIWVGFAPLKPAEFVILSLQQMAGQLEV